MVVMALLLAVRSIWATSGWLGRRDMNTRTSSNARQLRQVEMTPVRTGGVLSMMWMQISARVSVRSLGHEMRMLVGIVHVVVKDHAFVEANITIEACITLKASIALEAAVSGLVVVSIVVLVRMMPIWHVPMRRRVSHMMVRHWRVRRILSVSRVPMMWMGRRRIVVPRRTTVPMAIARRRWAMRRAVRRWMSICIWLWILRRMVTRSVAPACIVDGPLLALKGRSKVTLISPT